MNQLKIQNIFSQPEMGMPWNIQAVYWKYLPSKDDNCHNTCTGPEVFCIIRILLIFELGDGKFISMSNKYSRLYRYSHCNIGIRELMETWKALKQDFVLFLLQRSIHENCLSVFTVRIIHLKRKPSASTSLQVKIL